MEGRARCGASSSARSATPPISGATPAVGGWRDARLPSTRKNSPKINDCVFCKFEHMSRRVSSGATTYVVLEAVPRGIAEWWVAGGAQRAPHPAPRLRPRSWDDETVGSPRKGKNSPKIEGCVFRKSDCTSRCVTPPATTCVAFEPVASGITECCLPPRPPTCA